jgi:hypothetical protein
MKKKHFPLIGISLLLVSVLFICAWKAPAGTNYLHNPFINVNQRDTEPKDQKDNFNTNDIDKAMKNLNENMANLDIQMKNLNLNLDKQIRESLSKINFEEIAKQTEASLKEIDWNKLQQEVNNSLQQAQNEIAKIDFTKLQNDMKAMQEKLQSEEFKSQFNSDKLQKQIDEAMSKAKEGIEKAKQQLKRTDDFTNELAADGLIDKKKGYTIEWKNGSLYIDGKEQPKNVSDKYRKYENDFKGKIRMEPEGVEHF